MSALATITRALRYLWTHRVAALLTLVTAGLWLLKLQRDRARARAGVADHARVEAEDTAAVTTDALERRDAGAHTREDVIDAARAEAQAHPDDPEAPARAAREYGRERYRGMRATHPDGDPADPVRDDGPAGAAARGRGR